MCVSFNIKNQFKSVLPVCESSKVIKGEATSRLDHTIGVCDKKGLIHRIGHIL